MDRNEKAINALRRMCDHCHENIIAQKSSGDLPHKECPWRHISNDYCPEYEEIKEALEYAKRKK